MIEFCEKVAEGQYSLLIGWNRAEIYAIAQASRDGLLPPIHQIELVWRKAASGSEVSGQAFYFWLGNTQDPKQTAHILARIKTWLEGVPLHHYAKLSSYFSPLLPLKLTNIA